MREADSPVAKYARAPIAEAIIDIQIRPVDLSPERLVEAVNPLKEEYPALDKIQQYTVELSKGMPAPKEVNSAWVFKARNGKKLWQSRADGFTFSLLAPYDTWAEFKRLARPAWDAYRGVIGNALVTSVSVRYVNQLNLPLPLADLNEYLKTVVTISPELPQGLSMMFVQLAIPDNQSHSIATITQTFVPPPTPSFASVILDIGAARQHQLPETDDDLWKIVDELREVKNRYFEGCITDATRKLIS